LRYGEILKHVEGEQALELFLRLRSHRLSLDSWSYNAVLAALARAGKGQESTLVCGGIRRGRNNGLFECDIAVVDDEDDH